MRLHTSGPFKGHWRHGYGLVYADPPWRQETWGETNAKAPPYPTMTLAEMVELFARRNDRPGWSAWGNKTSLYNGIPDQDQRSEP